MEALRTTGIDHLNLAVIDADETTDFYRRLLGFEVLETFDAYNGRIIGNERAKLALYEMDYFDGHVKEHPRAGFAHMGFHVENFDVIETLLFQMGVEINYGGTTRWPKSRSIYITDPNGYEIELTDVWGGGL